jgi:hypothetical protein
MRREAPRTGRRGVALTSRGPGGAACVGQDGGTGAEESQSVGREDAGLLNCLQRADNKGLGAICAERLRDPPLAHHAEHPGNPWGETCQVASRRLSPRQSSMSRWQSVPLASFVARGFILARSALKPSRAPSPLESRASHEPLQRTPSSTENGIRRRRK